MRGATLEAGKGDPHTVDRAWEHVAPPEAIDPDAAATAAVPEPPAEFEVAADTVGRFASPASSLGAPSPADTGPDADASGIGEPSEAVERAFDPAIAEPEAVRAASDPPSAVPTLIRPARRIAVLNQKGGVGKTTTAIHLGAALARLGRRTLLVDLDPQAHLSLGLGVGPEENRASIYDVLCAGEPLAAAIHRTRIEGLELVPSHLDLAGAEIELATAIGREYLLRDSLLALLERDTPNRIERPIEVVLFDCPPSLGVLTVNALAAATEVLIPLQTHFFALQGMAKLLDVFSLVRKRLNPELRISGILPCLVDPRLRLSQEVLDEVQRHFGDVVLTTRIRSNVKLAEAPSHGLTVFEYAPESHGAQDYAALADEVLARSAAVPATS
jgi:chromosome partitioning protein